MKAIRPILCLAAALSLAGCNNSTGPNFVTSAQTKTLVPLAQTVVSDQLFEHFGSPSRLVAWSDLPVDFGVYSGTVGAGGKVELKPTSGLAWEERLDSLGGSAVLEGEGNNGKSLGMIESYDKSAKQLQLSEAEGSTLKEGVAISVVGDTLQLGRDLYLRHCLHCHGLSGDGDGPTAKYFTVRPRDYRKGTYKFTSTSKAHGANRDDLFRVIKLGVPGTYMPSFMLLPDRDVKALAEYVRWLSVRGQTETRLYLALESDYQQKVAGSQSYNEVQAKLSSFVKAELPEAVNAIATELKETWEANETPEAVLVPNVERVPPTKESIDRGRALFRDTKRGAKCFNCHGETGRGNGPSTETFNDKPGKPGEKNDVPGLFDDWGNLVKPRDLTTGIYRGGRRPIDIYRRIYAGIKGTPMQSFGGTSALSDEDIWDLTNYVLAVPFESGDKKKPAAH